MEEEEEEAFAYRSECSAAAFAAPKTPVTYTA